MKIEKLSDNQIRCTLTRADLATRELKLSELAYGTEKAKSLFHDMMEQAAAEFGFITEDFPLMIEAIPSTSGSVVLIITKVDDPDELDNKFSKFAPQDGASEEPNYPLDKLEGAEELLDLLNKVHEAHAEISNKDAVSKESPSDIRVRLFSFATIDGVIHAAHLLDGLYLGENTLYLDIAEDVYILALSQSDHTTSEFNRICNMLSEYGSLERATGINLAFLEEHCNVIISMNAVQQLKIV